MKQTQISWMALLKILSYVQTVRVESAHKSLTVLSEVNPSNRTVLTGWCSEETCSIGLKDTLWYWGLLPHAQPRKHNSGCLPTPFRRWYINGWSKNDKLQNIIACIRFRVTGIYVKVFWVSNRETDPELVVFHIYVSKYVKGSSRVS